VFKENRIDPRIAVMSGNQWEYLVASPTDGLIQDWLNGMGNEGWELVQLFWSESPIFAVFKRAA